MVIIPALTFAALQCTFYAKALIEYEGGLFYGDEHAIDVVQLYEQACETVSFQEYGCVYKMDHCAQNAIAFSCTFSCSKL